jgi:hypothetical protein
MAVTTLPEPGRVPAAPQLRLQHQVILALDLGQTTGWAVRNADSVITHGTVQFRPGRHEGGGMPFLRFRAWLQELDEAVDGIDAVFFEEVHGHRGTAAAQIYGGFLAHLTAWAEMSKVPYEGVPVGTIKRHITGKGNATKEDVIAAVRAKGFSPGRAGAARLGHRQPLRRRRTVNGPELLEHAAGLVNRRRREYGEPADLFEHVAARWSLTLGTKVSPAQVVLCLIDLKLARLARDPKHLDSIVDVAGYAAVLREVSP